MRSMQIWNPSASFTRPNNTSAYASGQLVANALAAGAVTPLQFSVGGNSMPGEFRLTRIRLFKSGTSSTNAVFRLHLYVELPDGADMPFEQPVIINYFTLGEQELEALKTHGEARVPVRLMYLEDD